MFRTREFGGMTNKRLVEIDKQGLLRVSGRLKSTVITPIKDIEFIYTNEPSFGSRGYMVPVTKRQELQDILNNGSIPSGIFYIEEQKYAFDRLIEIITENNPNIEVVYESFNNLNKKDNIFERLIALDNIENQVDTFHLSCPRCRSNNIQLVSTERNMKSKTSTSININPLRPLTVFNHKEKKKKKVSKGKLAAGILTGGTSLFFTGIKDNKKNEYHCMNCGKSFNKR